MEFSHAILYNDIDIASIYNIGLRYYYGNKCIQNYTVAFAYIKYAADGGYVNAMYEIGKLYYLGIGCIQDYYKSFYYLKMVEKTGSTITRIMLFYMYYYGRGCTKDKKMSDLYLKLIAENNYNDAQSIRNIVDAADGLLLLKN
jgi:TPR repeat protein